MARPEPDGLISAFDDVFSEFNRSDAPGLVVGISQYGKGLYRRGFGLACLELGVANTPSTRMRIASASKHFTCIAALLLAEEGKLDIDASIRSYVPELPILAGEPTLRQLMTHTGGYRCYLDLHMLGNGGAAMEKGRALNYQLQQHDVNFAPGERMMYCNGGYHLLAIAIARASEMSFETFLKQRIFEPMGMVSTTSEPSDVAVVPGKAAAYLRLADGSYRHADVEWMEDLMGDGAMVSTVDDMLVWLSHLRGNKRVGSGSSWAQMLAPASYSSGLTGTYGLGLERHMYRGVEVIYHSGSLFGGASQMITVPAHELDIIIITNGAPASPVELAWQVIDKVLGDDVLDDAALRAKATTLETFLGLYWSQDTATLVELTNDNGNVLFSLSNSKPLPVMLSAGKQYTVKIPGMGPISFRPVPASSAFGAQALDLSQSGHHERLERLSDSTADTADFADGLIGKYVSSDLDAVCTISFDGVNAILAVKGQYGGWISDLTVLSRDVAKISFTPETIGIPAVLAVDRDDTGSVRGFWLNSSRTRKLRFVPVTAA